MGIMKNCKKLLSVIVTLLLAASLLTSSAFAISGEAFIATPGEVNLRDSGSFNSNVIDAAPQGATVYVLGDAGYGWYKVSYNGKTGYMASYYLLFNEVPSAENVDSVPDKAPAQETTRSPCSSPRRGFPRDLRCASRDRRQQRHRSRLRHLLPQRPEHLQQRDRNA